MLTKKFEIVVNLFPTYNLKNIGHCKYILAQNANAVKIYRSRLSSVKNSFVKHNYFLLVDVETSLGGGREKSRECNLRRGKK